MNRNGRKIDKATRNRIISVVGGIGLNVFLAFLATHFELPLYMDCIGTIGVAYIGGILPGMIVGVATNFLCGFFNDYAIYYVFISILIAGASAYVSRAHKFEKRINIPIFVLVLALFGGGLGMVFQWVLLGQPQFNDVLETATVMNEVTGMPLLVTSMIANIGLNYVDKGISTVIVLAVIYFIPEEKRKSIWVSSWKQRPLTEEEINEINRSGKVKEHRLSKKITLVLMAASLALTIIISWITMRQYYESEKEEYTENVVNISHFVAAQLNGDDMERYLEEGEAAEGYEEVEAFLQEVKDASPHIAFLYVMKMERDACYAIFDLDTEEVEGYEPGDRIEIEEAFYPYMDDILAGNEIEPIESDDTFGWLITAYAPVKDSDGNTVCYVGADASLKYLSEFVRGFFLKVLLIFSGFFVLIIAVGIWMTSMDLIYPINTLVQWTGQFMKNTDDQKAIDKSVHELRQLDIRTGDEVESLYLSICKMATDAADQVRDIRYYADATSKMQNGLIITMADMVENRDSDTGAHIQKTAAYVKIISESLKRNGYYAEKLTPKYMSDIVMSAPLHDVGKINISDTVLNKPGKLTDEEYEIMKLHTVYGKEIMEKAISTVEGENYLKEARNMAAYHHERWDGKGYPEGLHGEVIPLSARIMAVADVFDALTSPRVYKPAFPLEKALQIIEEGSGTQFDPKCVNAFMDALPEVKLILRKYQDA